MRESFKDALEEFGFPPILWVVFLWPWICPFHPVWSPGPSDTASWPMIFIVTVAIIGPRATALDLPLPCFLLALKPMLHEWNFKYRKDAISHGLLMSYFYLPKDYLCVPQMCGAIQPKNRFFRLPSTPRYFISHVPNKEIACAIWLICEKFNKDNLQKSGQDIGKQIREVVVPPGLKTFGNHYHFKAWRGRRVSIYENVEWLTGWLCRERIDCVNALTSLCSHSDFWIWRSTWKASIMHNLNKEDISTCIL